MKCCKCNPGAVFTTVFFVTYTLGSIKLECNYHPRFERFVRDKHTVVLGALVSYEENECEYGSLGLYLQESQHFIFLITYEWAQQERDTSYITLHFKDLPETSILSCWNHSLLTKKMKFCEYGF